jgi:hypothetical protein
MQVADDLPGASRQKVGRARAGRPASRIARVEAGRKGTMNKEEMLEQFGHPTIVGSVEVEPWEGNGGATTEPLYGCPVCGSVKLASEDHPSMACGSESYETCEDCGWLGGFDDFGGGWVRFGPGTPLDPERLQAALDKAYEGRWHYDAADVAFASPTGLLHAGSDYIGRLVGGRTVQFDRGEVNDGIRPHEVDLVDLMPRRWQVRCEANGASRRFDTKAEAEQWAEWGHCCTREHELREVVGY